jgi:lactate permease
MSLSLYVLLIIWSAVFLYNLVDRLGAVKVIAANMTKVTDDKLLQCLLMSWCFAGFMQGVAGFGVPIAVVAPIMVVMGFRPAVAAASCLVGHCWSVTFGSMGAGYYTLQLITKIPGEIIGPWMAILFAVPIIGAGFAVAHIYGGWAAVKRGTPVIVITSLAMSVTCWLMTFIGAAQLAALIPGLVGCGTLAVIARSRLYRSTGIAKAVVPIGGPQAMSFHLAFSPYYGFVALSVCTQFHAVSRFFAPLTFGLNYPAAQTTMGFAVKAEKLYSRIGIAHPSFLLLATAILSVSIFHAAGKWKSGSIMGACKDTFNQCVPTSFGVITMVMMALVMNDTGMTYLLAQGVARATGHLFPLASVFIGVLGTFLTGSGANSNVMFASLQVETAKVLGISTVIIAAVQGVGGSIGGCVAPAKVLLGSTMVGLEGRESEVLNRTIPYCLGIALMTGITAWVFTNVLFRGLQ